jgi:hypothetical protein
VAAARLAPPLECLCARPPALLAGERRLTSSLAFRRRREMINAATSRMIELATATAESPNSSTQLMPHSR